MNQNLDLQERTITNVNVNLEVVELNKTRKYFINLAPAGKYPITKEFYYELDFLVKCNTIAFKESVATILKLVPTLQAA